MAQWLRIWPFSAVAIVAAVGSAVAWTPSELVEPCRGDCAVAVYSGRQLLDGLEEVLLTQPQFPTGWSYDDEQFVGVALSRRAGTVLSRVDLEPELGFGQRFGVQDEWEAWGALYFRYRGFPWDDFLTTTVALSTGLNYASDVSEIESEKARRGNGDRVMHFFSPEVTFALPRYPDTELLFRIHHRSGVFGLVSEAFGGMQYATFGLRVRY